MDERDTRVEGAAEDPDAPATVEVSDSELAPAADEPWRGDESPPRLDSSSRPPEVAAVEDPDAPVVVEESDERPEESGRGSDESPRHEEPYENPPIEEPGEPETPEGDPEPAEPPIQEPEHEDDEPMSADQLLGATEQPEADHDAEEHRKLAILEAIVYVTDEPLTREQIAKALGEPLPYVSQLLDKLVEEYNKPFHGLTVKEVAGGFKIATKAEHHEAVRTFVKNLNPPLKLSLAALETLAVIAYKQPITAPEIMEIRGVQGAGVLKTLLDRKLITTAGRKNVVGKPILYKTTKEFLVQFGLRDLAELPTLKEFEDLRRMAFADADAPGDVVDGSPVSEAQVQTASPASNE